MQPWRAESGETRPNFADLQKESDVRDVAGRGGPGREPGGSAGVGETQWGRARIDHMRTTVSLSIRTCGAVVARWVQPPDAENRTSGGVGGCMGANPMHSTRSEGPPHEKPDSGRSKSRRACLVGTTRPGIKAGHWRADICRRFLSPRECDRHRLLAGSVVQTRARPISNSAAVAATSGRDLRYR